MELPHVDPTGCEIVVWMLGDSVFFAEVANGQIYTVEEGMLIPLLESFNPLWTIGIYQNGKLGKIFPTPLQ